MLRMWLLTALVFWSSSLIANEREDNRGAAEAKKTLIDLVDNLAADGLARAEAAYGILAAADKIDLRANYALALVRTRHGNYKQAAELLDRLPNEQKRQSAVMRLRLWLALELGENAKADRIFQAITGHLTDGSLRDPERLEAAKTLGAVSSLMATLSPDAAPIKPATQRLAALTAQSDPRSPYAEQFAACQRFTAKRLVAVQELITATRTQAEAERPGVIAQREQSYETLRGEIAAGQAALDATLIDHRAKLAAEAAPLKDLKHRRGLLLKESRTATPGKPAVPRPPKVPVKPSPPRGSDKDDKHGKDDDRDYERDLRKYEDEVRSYPGRLADYQSDLATYPQRLAAWQDKDRVRRAEIRRNQDDVKAGIEEIESAREARQSAISEGRRETEKKERAADDLRIEIGLLRSLSDGDFESAAQRAQSRPSSYRIISYSAEQKRIMQLLER